MGGGILRQFLDNWKSEFEQSITIFLRKHWVNSGKRFYTLEEGSTAWIDCGFGGVRDADGVDGEICSEKV